MIKGTAGSEPSRSVGVAADSAAGEGDRSGTGDDIPTSFPEAYVYGIVVEVEAGGSVFTTIPSELVFSILVSVKVGSLGFLGFGLPPAPLLRN